MDPKQVFPLTKTYTRVEKQTFFSQILLFLTPFSMYARTSTVRLLEKLNDPFYLFSCTSIISIFEYKCTPGRSLGESIIFDIVDLLNVCGRGIFTWDAENEFNACTAPQIEGLWCMHVTSMKAPFTLPYPRPWVQCSYT